MEMKISRRELSLISHLRRDGRITLTSLSRQTGLPISTVYEKLKSFKSEGLVRITSLVDFAKLGFSARVMIAMKVEREVREQFEEYLTKHFQVNTVLRINNGFTFLVDFIFRDMREAEDFLEDMDQRFKLRNKMVFYIIGEVKREAFLSAWNMSELMLFGGDKDD